MRAAGTRDGRLTRAARLGGGFVEYPWRNFHDAPLLAKGAQARGRPASPITPCTDPPLAPTLAGARPPTRLPIPGLLPVTITEQRMAPHFSPFIQ